MLSSFGEPRRFTLDPGSQVERGLAGGQKRGEESGALGHGLYEDVFVGGMSAVPDGTEAVERGNAERGGEITIGAAAGGGFPKRESHLLCKRPGASEKSGTVFALHGRAIEPAVDFKFCAAMDGFKRVKSFFECAHVGYTPGTQIEGGFGALGDDVGA